MNHSATRLLSASLVLAGIAGAQTITWGPVLPSVAPTDVSTNGSLVFAGNSHGPGTPINATVNGVTFVGGFQPFNWNGYIVGGLNGSTTGNAEYDKLLSGSRAMQNASAPPDSNPTAWGGIRLDTLATLNAGYTYEVQVWFTDQRTGSPTNVLYDRVMTLSSAWGTATVVGGAITNLGSMQQGPLSGPMEADPDNAPATTSPDTVFGTHCTGTFTYTPGAETWLLIQGSHPIATNVLQPHITALQIRDLSSAHHAAYGSGCYSFTVQSDSVHEFFPLPSAASAALQGNSMILFPTVDGYSVAWIPGGAAAYLPPTGAAGNVFAAASDDGNVAFTLPSAMPIPGGTTGSVNVMSNGVLSLGAASAAGTDYEPTSTKFGTHTLPAIYAGWHDWNETEGLSGRIKQELVGGIQCITWDDVESYADPDTTVNRGTMQVQLDLASGVIQILWVAISPDDSETTFAGGRPYLVGVGGPATVAAAPITLSTGLPVTTAPNVTLQPLTLAASPAPVYTVGGPSVPVTYTATNVIDLAPPFGVGISLLMFSVAPIPGGFDAGFLDMPGCNINILSVDVLFAMPGTAPTSALTFSIPQPLSPGLSFYSQVLSLFPPNSLPGGLNTFGGLLSNGLRSTFNTF